MTSTFSISEFINKCLLKLREVNISCLLVCNYLGWQYSSVTHSAVEGRDRSAAVSAELWWTGWTETTAAVCCVICSCCLVLLCTCYCVMVLIKTLLD